jgi:hypothetical protein
VAEAEAARCLASHAVLHAAEGLRPVGAAGVLEVGEASRVADNEAFVSPFIDAAMRVSSFMRPNQNFTDVMVWAIMLGNARTRVCRIRTVTVQVSVSRLDCRVQAR